MDHDLHFSRQFRTVNSEGYDILTNERKLGRVDLHYGATMAFGTLILFQEMDDDAVRTLIETIDEDIVTTVDFPRSDFLVTIYFGKEHSFLTDEDFEDPEDE